MLTKPASRAGAWAFFAVIDWLFKKAHYPFDYPFETDNFCMYSLMGNPEPDIEFSYSLRF